MPFRISRSYLWSTVGYSVNMCSSNTPEIRQYGTEDQSISGERTSQLFSLNLPSSDKSNVVAITTHNLDNITQVQVLDAWNIMDTDDCNGNRRWVILKITVIFLLRHSLKGIGRLKMRNEPGYIELSGGNSTLLKAIKYLINWFVVILVNFWVFDKLIKSN